MHHSDIGAPAMSEGTTPGKPFDRDTQAQIASLIWHAIEDGRDVTDIQRGQLIDFIRGKSIVTWDVPQQDIDMIQQMQSEDMTSSPAVEKALAHFKAVDGALLLSDLMEALREAGIVLAEIGKRIDDPINTGGDIDVLMDRASALLPRIDAALKKAGG